jgi:hypothetical protein
LSGKSRLALDPRTIIDHDASAASGNCAFKHEIASSATAALFDGRPNVVDLPRRRMSGPLKDPWLPARGDAMVASTTPGTRTLARLAASGDLGDGFTGHGASDLLAARRNPRRGVGLNPRAGAPLLTLGVTGRHGAA